MLPPKMGDGVLGSNSGGLNPTGASFVGASSAMALMVVLGGNEDLGSFGAVKESDDDDFHGAATRSPERVGVKREAWVAMAMENCGGGVI